MRNFRWMSLGLTLVGMHAAAADAGGATQRQVRLDLSAATAPMDRFFDFSVGADYPGTTRARKTWRS